MQRIILEVPFSEKDEAKALGAWWDPDLRKWFVPTNRSPEPFRRWYPSQKKQSAAEERE